MVSITKRFFAFVLLLTLLFSGAPVHQPEQNSVSATTSASIPDVSLNLINATTEATILINEVMFRPSVGEYEWVELKNIGPGAIDIGGFLLTDEDDHWYQFPDALPPVPEGAFVVVTFDGAGSASDDYDFADNVAYLHSQPGLINIFEDDQDQVALYRSGFMVYLPLILGGNDLITAASTPLQATFSPPFPEDMIAFVAWGAPPLEDANHAEYNGLWNSAWYVSLSLGLGLEYPIETDNFSIGLLPNAQHAFLDDWELFLPSVVTKGSENECPMISWYYPADGALLDSDTLSVSWNAINNATNYHFQMDDQDDFSSPIVDIDLTYPAFISTTAIPDGLYYWRVRVTVSEVTSDWSPVHSLEAISLSALLASSGDYTEATRAVSLPITWQLQHKDTNMLCLDGDHETGPNAWDSEHVSPGKHGKMYCARATMAMMASYYGSNLSQDRISYEIFGSGDPEGDLGHNVGAYPGHVDLIINWSLGMPIARHTGKPSFEDIKTWIDEGRPIFSATRGHARLINGYGEIDLEAGLIMKFIRLLDPWDRAKWVAYADDDIILYWVGPPGPEGAPEVVMEEDLDADGIPDTIDDSDGDGICDFDERERFNTLYNNPDSDGDGVPDKQDLREYVFNSTGDYNYRNPDWDHDGLRKEIDPDNDNGGSLDGWEDFNHNGIYEPALGETSNFDKNSERDPSPPPIIEFDCSTVTDVPQIECEALVAIYSSTNGDGWSDNSRWLYSTTVGNWGGVGVSDGHVVTLNLGNNGLVGSIPAKLSNLSKLEYILLYLNDLSGGIPPELGNLSNLVEIRLAYNQLSGTIPSELGNLKNLETLWLEHNQLSGSIPENLGNSSNLISLDINTNNQLTDSIPLSFVNLTNLLEFYFYGTDLCEPSTPEFIAWKNNVIYWEGTDVTCP
jgi:hypothetical protein